MLETSNFVHGLAMRSLSLVMCECSLSGRVQGHVSNFYIVDLENFATATYRWYTQLDRRRFVYDTYKTMKATRTHHSWVHMFITHWPTSWILILNCDFCAFSDLTLLVGRQERHPACKNWVVRCWRRYLSGARCRLNTAQLMPLPLTDSCFSKILIGFTFLIPAYPGSPGKGPLNGCVCVAIGKISTDTTHRAVHRR